MTPDMKVKANLIRVFAAVAFFARRPVIDQDRLGRRWGGARAAAPRCNAL
jgi:hypothetical protein